MVRGCAPWNRASRLWSWLDACWAVAHVHTHALALSHARSLASFTLTHSFTPSLLLSHERVQTSCPSARGTARDERQAGSRPS